MSARCISKHALEKELIYIADKIYGSGAKIDHPIKWYEMVVLRRVDDAPCRVFHVKTLKEVDFEFYRHIHDKYEKSNRDYSLEWLTFGSKDFSILPRSSAIRKYGFWRDSVKVDWSGWVDFIKAIAIIDYALGKLKGSYVEYSIKNELQLRWDPRDHLEEGIPKTDAQRRAYRDFVTSKTLVEYVKKAMPIVDETYYVTDL